MCFFPTRSRTPQGRWEYAGDLVCAVSHPSTDAATIAEKLDVWRAIYEKDIAMMARCDIIIANLTPFGGASADAGTLIEVGWFLGRGKPIFGYSSSSESFESRMRKQLGDGNAEFGIEGFTARQSDDRRCGPERRIPCLRSQRRQSARHRCAGCVRGVRGGGRARRAEALAKAGRGTTAVISLVARPVSAARWLLQSEP
jgi:Nucleoside 2-deoxyribosyltransferase